MELVVEYDPERFSYQLDRFRVVRMAELQYGSILQAGDRVVEELATLMIAIAAAARRIHGSLGEERSESIFRMLAENFDEDSLGEVRPKLRLDGLQVITEEVREALAL